MYQRGMGFDGIAEGKAGVLAQPALELYLKTESIAQVLLKEGPKVLGAYDVGGDDLVQGSGYLTVDRTPFCL